MLDLRYQLLTGMAGAVAAATLHDAANAVFLVHEFITPETTPDTQRKNARALHDIGTTVFDLEFPTDTSKRWCVGPLDIPGDGAALRRGTRLYIEKAVTDWSER